MPALLGVNRLSTQKPSLGAQLNTSHPLSQGLNDYLLFNEDGGNPLNLGTPSNAPALVSNVALPTWSSTSGGAAVYIPGLSGQAISVPDHGNYSAQDLTVRCIFYPRSWPIAYTILFDKGGTSTRELDFFFDTNGALLYGSIGGTGGAAIGMSKNLTAGHVWDFVVTRPLVGGLAKFYVNGVFVGSNSMLGTVGAPGAPLGLGLNGSGGGGNANADYIHFATWKRVLSAAEIQQLYITPYINMLPSPRYTTGTAGAALNRTIQGVQSIQGIQSIQF